MRTDDRTSHIDPLHGSSSQPSDAESKTQVSKTLQDGNKKRKTLF